MSSMRLLSSSVALGLLTVLVAGCGGPRSQPVNGTITLDGQPLAEGDITFRPQPVLAGSPGFNTPVKDGKYHLQVPPGANRVEITGTKLVPGKLDPFGNPMRVSVIPRRYSGETTLEAKVSEGSNTFDFRLTSK